MHLPLGLDLNEHTRYTRALDRDPNEWVKQGRAMGISGRTVCACSKATVSSGEAFHEGTAFERCLAA